jgi:membrane protein implicated in regulation of membrane protease activity
MGSKEISLGAIGCLIVGLALLAFLALGPVIFMVVWNTFAPMVGAGQIDFITGAIGWYGLSFIGSLFRSRK